MMPDYEKLTVVKLRDELTARGLPKTGLKAALVQRLIEADARSEKTEPTANQLIETSREDDSVIQAADSGSPRESRDDVHTGDDVRQSKEQERDTNELENADVVVEDVPLYKGNVMLQTRPQKEVQEAEQLGEQASGNLMEPHGHVFSQNGTLSEELSKESDENAIESDLYSSVPVQTHRDIREVQVFEDKMGESSQTMLTGDEVSEDSRKRKRRSQSPPPSSVENTQKRLKADNCRPLVELPEDIIVEHTGTEENDAWLQRDPTNAQESDARTNGHTYASGESEGIKAITCTTVGQIDSDNSIQHPQIEDSALSEMGTPKEKIAAPTQIQNVESPVNPLPPDTRFKNLFTAPANLGPASQQLDLPDAEDKTVSPAVHPATSALYIRELMRPLKIESLRDHLVALATPPDTTVSPDIVTDFFLDSVRTHCLVGFENISAASRVRSGLHDRVWPDERDRRQLWVDFVPEEKLKKWIDVEQTAGTGRGQPSKRWEVVYEDEGDGIKAYLQEAGSNGGAFRAAQSSRMDTRESLRVAPPSGPRISGSEPQSSQTKLDSGKGFKALDDLFMSTAAKPKLYYLPVSKVEADRRLAKLAEGRGGGHGDEMRRFSFEEGSLVDNGPEFGRGGYGRRGGYLGSLRGRGRGPRGDAPRGDSKRDRRSGY